MDPALSLGWPLLALVFAVVGVFYIKREAAAFDRAFSSAAQGETTADGQPGATASAAGSLGTASTGDVAARTQTADVGQEESIL